jgi:hypothetical protein
MVLCRCNVQRPVYVAAIIDRAKAKPLRSTPHNGIAPKNLIWSAKKMKSEDGRVVQHPKAYLAQHVRSIGHSVRLRKENIGRRVGGRSRKRNPNAISGAHFESVALSLKHTLRM